MISLCFPLQTVPTIGRSSLSLIQLTNSSPGQRPQNHTPMAAAQQNNMTGNRGPRPLDQVTCYKVSHLSIGLLMCHCVLKIRFRHQPLIVVADMKTDISYL